MTIRAVLGHKGRDVETIIPAAKVSEAISCLGARRIGALPVCDEGGVTGIISERDIIYALRDHGPGSLDWPVERIMSSPAITVDPDASVLAALALMTNRKMRHLPVVESGQLVGIVSIGDLVKHRMDRIEAEADAMRDYIRSA